MYFSKIKNIFKTRKSINFGALNMLQELDFDWPVAPLCWTIAHVDDNSLNDKVFQTTLDSYRQFVRKLYVARC